MVDEVGLETVGRAVADADGPFDVKGHLRRARRLADLSQRDLAAHLGVSSSAVARWEVGDAAIAVRDFDRVLRLAGLRLCVIDGDRRSVEPVPADGVRDNAGRCFPAHLDVVPPDQRPANRGLAPRWDRRPARGWYALRATREAATSAGHDRQAEHPTQEELALRRHRVARLASPHRLLTGPATAVQCECLDDCPEHPACPAECPCQCEPAGPAGYRARLE